MSKHSGKVGMGSHKHSISGQAGAHPRIKQNLTREANAEIVEKARRKEKKRQADLYSSVKDALDKHKKQ